MRRVSQTDLQMSMNGLCSSFREDGVAVITPTEEDIALEITVTNRGGDDAHQTHSIISLPDTLHYSSVVTTASVRVTGFRDL